MKTVTVRAFVALSFLWAGVSLGGNLIAAPAKFTVETLPLPLALQVGRAQFHWLGYAEVILALMLVAMSPRITRRSGLTMLVALCALAAQQGVLLPQLSARTDLIVSGQTPAGTSPHLIFVCAEAVKFAALIATGCFALSRAVSPPSYRRSQHANP
ncbi:hypothetical protein KX928_06675 [Roseobacter sp. YSTF-M11]|uniref:DUF4149 domain-containing protein n=1 Tax=Roseobacter insulae TaxID=2859783 RepID=A0A9X1FTP4_9RHOB|nr:hypothetical protein [Roseobacter insulae]MBW4707467.1 hypothetical protein [Roseobacter insulae]